MSESVGPQPNPPRHRDRREPSTRVGSPAARDEREPIRTRTRGNPLPLLELWEPLLRVPWPMTPDGSTRRMGECQGGSRPHDLPAVSFCFLARRSRTPSSPPGERACLRPFDGASLEVAFGGSDVCAGASPVVVAGDGVPPPHPATTPARARARKIDVRSPDKRLRNFMEVLVLPRDSTPGATPPRDYFSRASSPDLGAADFVAGWVPEALTAHLATRTQKITLSPMRL